MEYTRDENASRAPHIELCPIRPSSTHSAQGYESGLIHEPRSLVRAATVATPGMVAVTVGVVECVDTG